MNLKSCIAIATAALSVAACEVRPLYQPPIVEVPGDYYYPYNCYEFGCARRVVVVSGRRGYYIGPRFYPYVGPVYYHGYGPWRRPVRIYYG